MAQVGNPFMTEQNLQKWKLFWQSKELDRNEACVGLPKIRFLWYKVKI